MVILHFALFAEFNLRLFKLFKPINTLKDLVDEIVIRINNHESFVVETIWLEEINVRSFNNTRLLWLHLRKVNSGKAHKNQNVATTLKYFVKPMTYVGSLVFY